MYSMKRDLQRLSLLVTAQRKMEWVRETIHQPEPGEVLVETIAGAVSIGSELPLFRGDARLSERPDYPFMTGYESYGRITAVGTGVSDKYLGETVIAFYGHRTHDVLPLNRLIFAPSRFAPPAALLAILTCDVAKGIRKLHIQPDERVLVTGAGAIGLMTVWVLKQYGVQIIHVIEPLEDRRNRALALGASFVALPDEIHNWPEEYPVGIECSSRNDAFWLLQQKAAHDGRICVLSDGNIEPLTLSTSFHRKELSVVGSSDGWNYQRHANWYWRLAEDTTLAKNIFDMTVRAEDLPATFAALADGDRSSIKILVNYATDARSQGFGI